MITRKKIIAIILLVASLSIVLSLQVFQNIFYKTTSDFFRPFIGSKSITNNRYSTENLQKRTKSELINQLIKEMELNDKQAAKLELLNSVKTDKNRLESLLEIRAIPGYKCVYAQIYIRDPVFWYESFSINKGSAAGIKPGCIVLCKIESGEEGAHQFAVAGRISKVTEDSSQVETIISKNCNLSVKIKDSQAAGILKGGTIRNAEPAIKVAYLPLSKNYKTRAEVFTSGLCQASEGKNSHAYHSTPGGLFIGNLSGKVKIVNNLNAEAKVTPAVDFDSMKYVIVLIAENNMVKTSE